MTSKDKKLKLVLELVFLLGRIDELKNSKTYLSSSAYYRRRLTALEDKVETLRDKLEDKDDVDEIKLTFNLSEDLFKSCKEPADIIQYLKRENFVIS